MKPNFRHGMYKSPEYRAWQAMKDRCLNPNNKWFARYGGRGISIADSWKNDFMAFFRSVGYRPKKGLSLDRIDNNKGYEPGNCRWATQKQQLSNTCRNVYVEWAGQKVTMFSFSKLVGIDRETLMYRLKVGKPLLSVPHY